MKDNDDGKNLDSKMMDKDSSEEGSGEGAGEEGSKKNSSSPPNEMEKDVSEGDLPSSLHADEPMEDRCLNIAHSATKEANWNQTAHQHCGEILTAAHSFLTEEGDLRSERLQSSRQFLRQNLAIISAPATFDNQQQQLKFIANGSHVHGGGRMTGLSSTLSDRYATMHDTIFPLYKNKSHT